MADDAGAMLVRGGLVSAKALETARAAVAASGGTIGEHLVAAGVITDDALTEFYRHRLLVPQVSPNALAKLKPKVVAAISADLAIELRAVPVTFDPDGNLMVAMSDPSDRHAVDQLGFFTGKYIVRAVATQMQIAWCLAHYYGHVTPLGRRLMQPRDPAAAAPAAPAPAATLSAAELAATAASKAATAAASAAPRAPTSSSSTAVNPAAPMMRPPTHKGDPEPARPEPEPRGIELDADEPPPTPAPAPKPVVRRAPADLQELETRVGEVVVRGSASAPAVADEPRIIIALDDAPASDPAVGRVATSDVPTLAPTVTLARASDEATDPLGAAISDQLGDDDSGPIALGTPTAASAPPADDDEIVLLSQPRTTGQRRAGNLTQVGIGKIGPATSGRAHRDTDVGVPSGVDAAAPPVSAAEPEPVPPGPRTEVMMVPPAFAPAFSDEPTPTVPGAAVGAPQQPLAGGDSIDDAWATGPVSEPPTASLPVPGATAPTAGDDGATVSVLMPDVVTAPIGDAAPTPAPVDLAKELTSATARLVELLRAIDAGQSRDEVVGAMMTHLAESHRRAGFLVVRSGELSLFALVGAPATAGAPPSRLPFAKHATLRTDTPSLVADVLRTQLPYRGPLDDDATRTFLQTALGAAPGELLLIPMVMRERVVGVLYADGRHRHTFDDHYGIAARAAGIALERIVKSKKA